MHAILSDYLPRDFVYSRADPVDTLMGFAINHTTFNDDNHEECTSLALLHREVTQSDPRVSSPMLVSLADCRRLPLVLSY